jgi:hypothetical protein
MTQAYNLSQLANNLNSTGQLDATDGLVNAVPIANGGTGASSASGARTNLDVAQAVYAVPAGGIIMWSGSVGSIPTGWFLCNGANGTPNLLDRFVIAAGSTYAVAATGGSANAIVVSHTHTATVTDPGHVHAFSADQQVLNASGFYGGGPVGITQTNNTSSAVTGISVANSTAGSSGTNANLPPYYALAFIMKS